MLLEAAMPLAATYQERAYAAVGLSAWDAQRLRGEHDCLTPADGADGLLDVNERARLMRAIAAAYGTMYMRRPDAFLWMGFAAIAIHDGVRPSSELAAATARHPLTPALDRGPLGRAARALFGAAPGSAAEDGVKAAFEANFAIFSDLFWVHLAYLDAGIEGLRALHRAGELETELLEGMTLVDRGLARGRDAGYRRVVLGNLLFFEHEQRRSVTPVFEKYAAAMAFATRAGLIGVPNEKLRQVCAAEGRAPDWLDAPEAGASYGPFDGRWRWLVASSWEPFLKMHERRRPSLNHEVWRAIDDDAEAPAAASHGLGRLARAAWRRLRGTVPLAR